MILMAQTSRVFQIFDPSFLCFFVPVTDVKLYIVEYTGTGIDHFVLTLSIDKDLVHISVTLFGLPDFNLCPYTNGNRTTVPVKKHIIVNIRANMQRPGGAASLCSVEPDSRYT